MPSISPSLLRSLLISVCLLATSGCAMLREFQPTVQAHTLTPGEYIAVKRGDILTSGELSAATVETLDITGLAHGACKTPSRACVEALADSPGVDQERRQSALAELWLALAQETSGNAQGGIADWMEVARHSYAYLFFTERDAGARAFEDRQTQVRDYYNLAAQEVSQRLFERLKQREALPMHSVMQEDGWSLAIDMSDRVAGADDSLPRELVPASSLAFVGLRSTNRRDGLGAELVAVTGDALPSEATTQDWSEMPAQVVTALLRFPGDNLAGVLAGHEATIEAHDPLRTASAHVRGQDVPLAANFSAGYGLWLSRSGFNRQSLSSLLGRDDGLRRAHLYLMQPFDPDRRIIVMIHGLASSPEAWTNVANEVMGDEELHRNYQIWQFYYPTNLPVIFNYAAIRQTLTDALHHFDPRGTSVASRDMVVVGHSMGGIISRLLVSSSGNTLLEMAREDHHLDDAGIRRVKQQFGEALVFEPVPNISRAVFLATPHRGTEVAGGWLARRLAAFIRLPLTLTQEVGRLVTGNDAKESKHGLKPLANSINNLDRNDPFVRAAARLPISPKVRYHSIIARSDPRQPLEKSNDGLVPYWSAHLDGAVSEKVITAGHSVQELSEAILELRRILHQDIREHATPQ